MSSKDGSLLRDDKKIQKKKHKDLPSSRRKRSSRSSRDRKRSPDDHIGSGRAEVQARKSGGDLMTMAMATVAVANTARKTDRVAEIGTAKMWGETTENGNGGGRFSAAASDRQMLGKAQCQSLGEIVGDGEPRESSFPGVPQET